MEILRLMTRLTLPTLVSLLTPFVSCSKHNSTDPATTASVPLPGSHQVETMISDYEKVSNEYVRVSKKLRDGDVSIAVRYLELERRAKEESAQLQQASAQMTLEQAKRVAAISARTAPYLQD